MAASSWRTPAVILLAAGVILSLNMGVRQTFGLFMEPMTVMLGVGFGVFSLAVAIQNLLWGLLTPVFGIMADRYGTGRTLVLGGVMYVLGLLVMAFGGTVFTLHLGAGILIGIAIGACGFPMVLAAVARSVSPERRALALGVAASGGSVGQFVLLPLSQVMISSYGWVTALVVLAVLSALIVPLAAALAGKPDGAAAAQPGGGIRAALSEARRHHGYLLLNGGFFVCGFHVAFVATHLPAYIVSCNLSPLTGATSLSIIGFFNILGGLMAGVLGGRFRKKHVLAMIYLARAVAIGLFLIAPKTELVVYLFSASFGLLWLSTVPLTGGLVGDIFGPRYMSTLFGFVMLSHQLGAFFGAWLGGLSYDYSGSYDVVWMLAVLLGLLAAVLHWPIPDQRVPEPAAGTA